MQSKQDSTHSLTPFFHPRVVAHIGASESGTYPSELFANLIAWTNGTVYPVNPRRTTVLGKEVYPAVDALPERPDLALITVPREAVGSVIGRCVDAGVPSAVVISSGFAESDQEGRRLQAELALWRGRIRIIGPNCAGLASIAEGFALTRLSGTPAVGSVSFVSSSGAIMMALSGVFSDHGVGLRYIASVGNQVDVTLEEVLDFFVDDPDTRVVTAFIEGIGSAERFVAVLRRAQRAGKRIVLVKAGRSEIGGRVAATHTAALASDGIAFTHVCEQFGAIVVGSIAEMVAIALLASGVGPEPGGRLGILSQSGGMASLAADSVSNLMQLSLPPLDAQTDSALHALPGIPRYATLTNPVDVRGDAARGRDIEDTIAVVLRQDAFDALFLLFSKDPYREVERETVAAIVRSRQRARIPIVVVWFGGGARLDDKDNADGSRPTAPSAIQRLRDEGVPVYPDITVALRAYNALVRRGTDR